MHRIIWPKGNFNICLVVTPFLSLGKHMKIEIRIVFNNFEFLPGGEWTGLTWQSTCGAELNPQIDELIEELFRAKETATKLFRDAKAGRITEEFFKNQEVNSE